MKNLNNLKNIYLPTGADGVSTGDSTGVVTGVDGVSTGVTGVVTGADGVSTGDSTGVVTGVDGVSTGDSTGVFTGAACGAGISGIMGVVVGIEGGGVRVSKVLDFPKAAHVLKSGTPHANHTNKNKTTNINTTMTAINFTFFIQNRIFMDRAFCLKVTDSFAKLLVLSSKISICSPLSSSNSICSKKIL